MILDKFKRVVENTSPLIKQQVEGYLDKLDKTDNMIPYTKEDVLLKVDNVSFEYDAQHKIIKDMSFEVKDIKRPGMLQGQVLSLVGRSGVGKTTLFRLLAGLLKPNAGEITAMGKPIKPGIMGIVPQNYLLFNHRTVKNNLKIAERKGNSGLDFNDLVEKFGVSTLLHKYPLELSGGQKQRVSIIQQLLNGSDFILLDEPFSGLDRIVKKEVIKVLNNVSLMCDVKTLIIVSHDFESSVAISDTVLLICNDGEGAYIKKEIDMLERGLAWRDSIQEDYQFRETLKEIENSL